MKFLSFHLPAAASRAMATVLLSFWSAAAIPAGAAIGSPLEIAGHVLWLDSDDFDGDGQRDTGVSGTPAAIWVDKSSGLGINSVEVTAGEPTLEYGEGGEPNAVRFFGGSLDKMDNTEFFLADNYTVFTVVHSTDFGGSGHVLSGIKQDGTDTVLYRTAVGSYRIYSGQTSGNTDMAITTRPGDVGRVLFGYQVNELDLETGFYQNLETTFELNGPVLLDGLRIGNLDRGVPSNDLQSEAFSGDIHEVIMYSRVLTPAEITDVRNYLNSKYDLEFVEPVLPTGAMTENETGMVSGGIPSTLDPQSEPVLSGRTNLALAGNGGIAFGQDYIGPGSPRDFRPYRMNDGFYSDLEEGPPPIEEPWIGASINSFAGIAFPEPVTIDRIGFENQFLNRRNGLLIFEFTKDNLGNVPEDDNLGLDPFSINGKTWTLLDVKSIQDPDNTRHLYSFAAIEGVTAVRIRIESTAAEFAISEFEVWGVGEAGPPLPEISITGVSVTATEIALTFARPFPASGFAYVVEATTGTPDWAPVPGAVFASQGQVGGVETVRVTLPRPPDPRYYLRIRVTAAP